MIHIDLKDQVALVTDGLSGTGAAISRTLAEAGAVVWVNSDDSKEEAEALCADIRARGGRAKAIQVNVSHPEEVETMFATILEHDGKIDCVINNAETTSERSLLELGTKEWDRVLSVNLDGPFLCSKHALPHMVKAGSGVIVNISSAAAVTGGGGGAHYAASKSALDSMTRALAREYAPHGIRINGLAPALLESDISMKSDLDKPSLSQKIASIPARRLGTPQDVAAMTAVLCSSFSDYLSGETILMDGGLTFA